jgi:putative MATE family efflux protein
VNSTEQKNKELKATLTEKDRIFRERSLNGTMWKVVLIVGLPLAMYQSLQQIFSILDTMMASHISALSVSAVAYLNQLNQILSAIGNGLAVGSGILISRAYGMGDYTLVRKRVSTIYAIALAAGAVILCGILPIVNPFLKFCGTPDELIAVGASYFRVELFVIVITFLNAVYVSVERARGNTKRILWLNLAVIFTKLGLTAYFVYVLNGDLVMIAYASLIAQLVLFVFAIKNSIAGDNAFGFSLKAITFHGNVTAPMIKQSIPVMIEKALFAWGKTIVNTMATVYGSLMVGAMGVSNNLGGITTNPQNGFQDGASAVISQNFGAKKYKRVLSAFYSCMIINMILGAVISGLELLNLNSLAGLFASQDPEFAGIIAEVYKWEALGAVPLGANAAVLALLYGLGETKLTLVCNFSRVFLFRIPVLWFLQNFTSVGEMSCGIVMFVSNTGTAVFALIIAAIVIHKYKKKYLTGSVRMEEQTA